MKYLKGNKARLRKKFRLRKSLLSSFISKPKDKKKSKNFILHEALNLYFELLAQQDLFIYSFLKDKNV